MASGPRGGPAGVRLPALPPVTVVLARTFARDAMAPHSLAHRRPGGGEPTLLSDNRSDVRKGGVMQREPCLDIHHLAFQLGQLFVHPCEPEARRLLCNTSTNNQRVNISFLARVAGSSTETWLLQAFRLQRSAENPRGRAAYRSCSRSGRTRKPVAAPPRQSGLHPMSALCSLDFPKAQIWGSYAEFG